MSLPDFKPPHGQFWEPSIREFWQESEPSVSKAGFPCFLSFVYHVVERGDKGDEDASRILDDLIYIYPDTIPQNFQQALVGGLLSFTTFSRLNLDSMLTSFSWSESEIAIQSLRLTDGNYVLFVLKMPQFFSQYSVNLILKRTLDAYKMTSEIFSRDLSPADVPELQRLFQNHTEIIGEFTFNPQNCLDDPFSYGARPIEGFPSRSALAISTQLFDFVKVIQARIVGSAIFYREHLILSSLSPDLTSLFPIYKKLAKEPSADQKRFIPFQVWISPLLAGTDDSPVGVPMTLGIGVWEEISFFLVIIGHDEVDGILGEAYDLLANGMVDFANECASYPTNLKTKTTGIIAFWPDTGNIRRSRCSRRALERMGEGHDEFAKHRMLQEVTTWDGQTQMTGMRLMDVEVFVEVDAKGPFQAMESAYTKMKQFLQNLPDDLQKL
jgi:hypothetical protein